MIIRPQIGGWVQHAACADHDELDWFTTGAREQAKAIAVCNTCAVQAECLAHAISAREEHGIWGGQRIEELPRRRTRPIVHGTEAGYQRHRRHGETACAACKRANADAKAARQKVGA